MAVQVLTHRKVTVEVTPMTFITAEMKSATVGSFRISCQIHAQRHGKKPPVPDPDSSSVSDHCGLHLHPDGMSALFLVEKCPDPVVLPGPEMRNVKHSNNEDYDYNYEGEDAFNVVSFQPKNPKVQARASGGVKFQVWEYYIAIEEITWDYAPHLKPTDRSERWRKHMQIFSTISD